MMFVQNEGMLDRGLRVALGFLILFYCATILQGIWAWVGVIVGIILVITGITGFCLLYKPLGWDTRESPRQTK